MSGLFTFGMADLMLEAVNTVFRQAATKHGQLTIFSDFSNYFTVVAVNYVDCSIVKYFFGLFWLTLGVF